MSQPPASPPSRWAPLKPQAWPQDKNEPPSAGGLQMPSVSLSNAVRAGRESFIIPGTWSIPFGNAVGQQYPLYLPTPQDGDFWCDQIAMVGWYTSMPAQVRPPPSLISIADGRTGRALTWPNSIPTNFLVTLQRYSEDPGFDVSSSPFPDGFRSTSILAQPFCFTRAAGIVLNLTMLAATVGPDNLTIDIAFTGWKEYANASS